MARDTRTGSVLEDMVRHALQLGGYSQTQRVIGSRPGGGKHKVDVLASKAGRTILVSLKWQQVSGTAEQKVPFEVICLADAVRESNGTFDAYLVLGGEGWTLREFFVGGGLRGHLKYAELAEIMTLEGFVGLANAGRL
jgi:PD-(D/E)XK nuclease superfamily domain